MQHFFEWVGNAVNSSVPWLILGKGPSFEFRLELDLSRFHLLSLNHAVREQQVVVAHIIDLDVVEACGESIERNARVLVMPWYPHRRNVAGHRTLEEIAEDFPVLRRLKGEGRLLWYDLSTSPRRHGSWPVIRATYFSAEAALNLLASAGVRQVRSLGVDGGSAYSAAFEDLRDSTLLANGRSSFDLQFAGFARTILSTGVDFAPADMPAPARVYVAHTPAELLPAAVLQYSIRLHCSLSVEVVLLPVDAAGPVPPGPAVLLPPRAQVVGDLRPLWRTPVGQGEILVPQGDTSAEGTGVAVVGSGLNSKIPELAGGIRRRVSPGSLAETGEGSVRATLAARWNPSWQTELNPEAPLLYYPADGSEPWISRNHPLAHLWVRDLLSGIGHGSIDPQLVSQAVQQGQVRPSLLYQVERGLEEPLLLGLRARLLDREFERGHGSLSAQRTAAYWARVTRAVARHLRHRIRLLRARRLLPSSGTPHANMMGRQ